MQQGVGWGRCSPCLSSRVDSPDVRSTAQGRTQEGILNQEISKSVPAGPSELGIPPGPHVWAPGSVQAGSPEGRVACRLHQRTCCGEGGYSNSLTVGVSPRVGRGCSRSWISIRGRPGVTRQQYAVWTNRPRWGPASQGLSQPPSAAHRPGVPKKRGRSLRRVQKPPGLGKCPLHCRKTAGGEAPSPGQQRRGAVHTDGAGWQSLYRDTGECGLTSGHVCPLSFKLRGQDLKTWKNGGGSKCLEHNPLGRGNVPGGEFSRVGPWL